MGDNFNPIEVTKILNIEPTEFWRKGDQSAISKATKKYDCWLYRIGFKECYNDESLWKELYDIFNCKITELRKIIEELQLNVSFDIIVEMPKNQAPGLFINRNTIKMINDLTGTIDIDLYVI